MPRQTDTMCFRCRNDAECIRAKDHIKYCPLDKDPCDQCVYLAFMERDELRSPSLSTLLSGRKGEKCENTVSYWDIDVSSGSLSKDISMLLVTNLFHDVEMKCGEHSLKLHKLVLCARSDVFIAMLQSDMQEGRTGVIEIQDMDFSDLQDFIIYMYTDALPELTIDKATVLFETGDKYAVRSLMHRCAEYLLENLSLENIYHCLALAELHNDQKMKEGIITYILNQKVYLQHELWLPLSESHPEVAKEVRRLSCTNVTEKDKCVQTEGNWNVDGSVGSLSKDFSKLLYMGVNTDVEVKCGQFSAKVHKIVLCARSDFFMGVLLENGSRLVEIEDMDVYLFEDFIRYLYTDVIQVMTLNQARMLHWAGVKYGVRNLTHRCTQYVQENLHMRMPWEYAMKQADEKTLLWHWTLRRIQRMNHQ